MNEIQIFNNPQFGEIRTLEEKGKVLFCAKDVALALGYKDPTNAIKLHCRGVVKRHLGVQTGIRADGTPAMQKVEMNFIPEGDIYRLAAKSELPGADKFESWIFDEVLPAIRKTGTYTIPDKSRESLAEAKLLNARARVSSQWLKIAQQVSQPEYKQICAHYASGALTGAPVIPLPVSEQRYYTASEVGAMFGITAQKVGTLSNQNGLKVEQYGKWFHDKSRYSSKEVDSFRYNDQAIEAFRKIVGGVKK